MAVSFRRGGFLLLLWLASFNNCALGFELVVRVTNFANDTISVVLHSPLINIPIGPIQEQESITNKTKIPNDAGRVIVWFVQLNDSEEYLPETVQSNGSSFDITIYGSGENLHVWSSEKQRRCHTKSLICNTVSGSHPTLLYDEALLAVENRFYHPINVTQLSSICYKCKEVFLTSVYPNEVVDIIVDTKHNITFFLYSAESTKSFANHSDHFLEHSEKNWTVYSLSYTSVLQDEDHLGQNPNLPILYVAIVLIGSFTIWIIGVNVYNTLKRKGMLHFKRVDREISKDLGDPEKVTYGTLNSGETTGLLEDKKESEPEVSISSTSASGKKERVRSLDTFRGMSLIIMIFVNYGGGGYWFFNHSIWNGLTVADLVFPWFVWIMGVSIVYSFHGRKRDSFKSRLYQIVRRSIILLGLGLFLNNDLLLVPWFVGTVCLSLVASLSKTRPSPFLYLLYRASLLILWVGIWVCHGYQLSHWRIPGVLQRFAIAYFVVAVTELLSPKVYSRIKLKWQVNSVSDLTHNWIQWSIVLLLEVIWLAITLGLKAPGCPRGYLGPGGIADNASYRNCTGGIAGYIDSVILGKNHIYHHPTCKAVYLTGSYDPEGILGSINSIVMCFFGVQAGRIFIHHKQWGSRMLRFFIWGLLLGALGAILCEGSLNDGVIPLNKNLWSLSFILVLAGMGYILLMFLYFVVDVIKIWNGAPFVYPGMNSIMVYVGSELLEGIFPFGWSGMESSHLEFLISNVISVGLWTLIAYYWYIIKFFVKI